MEAWITTAAGGGLGFLLRVAWDIWFSDSMKSRDELLARLDSGQITSRGRARLSGEADDAWRVACAMETPRRSPQAAQIHAGSTLLSPATSHATSCPADHDGEPVLYLSVDAVDVASVADEVRRRLDTRAEGVARKLLHANAGKKDRILWIHAPNLLVRTAAEAELATRVARDASVNHVPQARIVLELALSRILQNELSRRKQVKVLDERAAIADAHPKDLTSAQRYAYLFDHIVGMLRDGAAIGFDREFDGSAFDEASRAGWRPHVFDDATAQVTTGTDVWTTVTIIGPPGSLKSATARELARQLRRARCVVVYCGAERTFDKLVSLPSRTDRAAAIREFLEPFAAPAELPAILQRFPEGSDVFCDALAHVISSGDPRVVLFIDDLHAHREIRDAVAQLRIQESKQRDGWQFVLTSRSRIDPVPAEKMIAITTRLLDRPNATAYLQSLRPTDARVSAAELLASGWLGRRSEYSTHLLRLVADISSPTAEPPTELLRDRLEAYLAPLRKVVAMDRQHYANGGAERLIASVRAALEEQQPPEQILRMLDSADPPDVHDVFGVLSWVSRFDVEDARLNEGKVSRWGEISQTAAKNLLAAGTESGIFSSYRGAASWSEPLVADGCAALYLSNMVSKAAVAVPAERHSKQLLLAGMIQRLYDQNSIDILSLALDYDVTQELIDIIATHRPHLSAIIDQMLTPDVLASLVAHRNVSANLFHQLMQHGIRVGFPAAAPICSAIAKLASINDDITRWCYQFVGTATAEADLAGAILAATADRAAFLASESRMTSAESILAAARMWPLIDEETLLQASLLLRSDDAAAVAWRAWCSRWESQTQVIRCERLIALHSNVDERRRAIVSTLLGETLSLLASSDLRKLREHAERLLRTLATEGADAAMATTLVKWVAHAFMPDKVESGMEWLADPALTFAVPRESCKPVLAGFITNELYRSDRFTLPRSEDLQLVGAAPSDRAEIVADGLPRGFRSGDPILPAQLRLWPAKTELPFVQASDINTRRYPWRPKFLLRTK